MDLPYRLLAVDVDGTLMNSRNELPAANRDALHRAHQAGLTVCLCTGRSLTETRAVIEQLGLDSDAGIFVFGAVVSRLPGGETISRTGIDAPIAARLIAHFQSRGYPVLILHDSAEISPDCHLLNGRRNAEAYERWTRLAPAKIRRIDAWQPGQFTPVRIGIIDDPAHIKGTIAELHNAFSPSELKFNSIYAPNYGLHVVECFGPQVNKWYGIMQLVKPMGIAGSQVVAIGDDVNDLEVIRNAGLSIAMGNAIEPIKAAARWHAPSNNDCGVAVAVDAILSGKHTLLKSA